MVTREDLKLISTESFRDGHLREVVEYDGNHYIVGSVECPVDVNDSEAFMKWVESLGETGIMVLLGLVPLNETFVMEAKFDENIDYYVPKNECGEHCRTGVCNKRLASNTQIGNHDLAYSMLIAHLNA
jgi:hypothetical protein